MSYWLGLDFETTGLDVENDSIIEVGAVLWDVERKSAAMMFGSLIEVHVPIPAAITSLTGITDADINDFSVSFERAALELYRMASYATHIIAHNGTNFDRPILKTELERLGLGVPDLPWIDSAVDVNYPAEISTRKLSYLAAEHGFLNPFPHRAVSDVLTMLKVVSAYDPKEIEHWAASPNVTLKALVSYDDRALASARGYRWDAYRKIWIKTMKEFKVSAEIASAGFDVELMS